MNVGQLIEKLLKLPLEAQVSFISSGNLLEIGRIDESSYCLAVHPPISKSQAIINMREIDNEIV